MMKFYVLLPDEKNYMIFGWKWAYGHHVKPINTGDAEYCPVCQKPATLLKWFPPHRISLSKAKPERWGDFLWVGLDLMVSKRFKDIYEKEGLTGIIEFGPPAEIVRVGTKKATEIATSLPEYHLITVPWGGADQDDVASGVIYEHPEKIHCSYCRVGGGGRKQEKIIIAKNSWSGADIFWPRGAPWSYIVSEKFKEVAEAYGLTNLRLVPSENFGYDTFSNTTGRGVWYTTEEAL